MAENHNTLRLKHLGIDTYKEAVIYMRKDCHICRSEGFEAQARVLVSLNNRHILATLNIFENTLLAPNEATLSNYAWDLLQAQPGDIIQLSHPQPLLSLSYMRAKVYGNTLNKDEISNIITDITQGYYSDIEVAAFLAACTGKGLNPAEIIDLTQAMVEAGTRLHWNAAVVVDKHCVGGLPGNRTSLIVVPIVTAFGLMMPKTSSRAITSPAGTADTMEVLAPVNLDVASMRKVVAQENGCIIWGGAVSLSPTDDILIRIENALDIDSEGQLVASVLSKKIAAGSTHVIIDIPIGKTAKVRDQAAAEQLKNQLITVGKKLGINICTLFTDGSQPIGNGIGPALEAHDVLAVLQNKTNAPADLKERALLIASEVLEFSQQIKPGTGRQLAEQLLASGKAWQKFQAICEAQGGMRTPPKATFTHIVTAKQAGKITAINNRRLAKIAKLAGAPQAKAAGVELLIKADVVVEKQQPLFTIHAETRGELAYALSYIEQGNHIFVMEPS